MIAFLGEAILEVLTAWGIATRRTRSLSWGRGSREEEEDDRLRAAEEDRRAGIRRSP